MKCRPSSALALAALALIALSSACSTDEAAPNPKSAESVAITAEPSETPLTKEERIAAAENAPDRVTPAPQETAQSPTPEPTLSEREAEDATYAKLHAEAGTEPRGGLASGRSDGRTMCTMLRNGFGAEPAGATGLLTNLKPPGGGELDEPAIAAFCPEFSEPLRIARTGFGEGAWLVGPDILAGQYRTFVEPGTSGTTDCYWERTSGSGRTLANDFVSLAPDGVTVAINDGEGFVSRGCGGWLPLE